MADNMLAWRQYNVVNWTAGYGWTPFGTMGLPCHNARRYTVHSHTDNGESPVLYMNSVKPQTFIDS